MPVTPARPAALLDRLKTKSRTAHAAMDAALEQRCLAGICARSLARPAHRRRDRQSRRGAVPGDDGRLSRVSNGEQCMALLRRADAERPTFVMLDLSTSGTGGLETRRQIKADPLLKAIPGDVVTASANPRDVDFCCQNGAEACHRKPVRHPDHLQLLARLLKYWLVDVIKPTASESSP